MSNATIKCWLARDKSGSLYMFSYKPHRTDGVFVPHTTDNQFLIVDNIFPELTWKNSPVEVELMIKPISMNKYNVAYKSTDDNIKTVQIVARNIEDAFSLVKEDYTDVAELLFATVIIK